MNNQVASSNARKVSVLLVDDEETVLRALTLLLSAIGFQVRGFERAEDALEHLSDQLRGEVSDSVASDSGRYDLILSDLKMPEMNGIDFLTMVQTQFPNQAFVLMSAHATDEEIDLAKRLGARAFLAKPFTPEQFREMVGQVCPTGEQLAV